MWTDSLGNPVTLRDEGSLAAVNDFVEGFIASEARAVNILAAAPGDGSAIVQAYAAAVHMFAESRDAPTSARPFLERAQAAASTATPREQRFIEAVAAWVAGDIPRAIALRRKEPWAHHALAHVMLTQGRINEGHAFLQDVSGTWQGLNSFMVTHNWWHQALFALELDRHEEVLALYDREVWGVAKDYTQDQINAVSLLARLELAGVDVGDRWQDVGSHLAQRTADQVLPFLDMQYLYGLARAGRAEADALMRNIEARAATDDSGAWRQVALPASRGLLAHAAGDYAAAVEQLGHALPRLLETGGSHAQRDLFSQIHLDAMIRSGRLSGAQDILQQQVRAQPESVRLRRQAAALYASLGLASATSFFWS
jgi:hypothetical protein